MKAFFSHSPRRAMAAMAVVCALSAQQQAFADTTWNWHYVGGNLNASGTLTASEAADPSGFHQITAISGNRNGDAITRLYSTGSAIYNLVQFQRGADHIFSDTRAAAGPHAADGCGMGHRRPGQVHTASSRRLRANGVPPRPSTMF